jgi:hypothetical protein
MICAVEVVASRAVKVVPGLVVARAAVDDDERARVEKMAAARHAPKDWVVRAQILVSHWDGWAVPQIAEQVGCSARVARAWIHRFNAEGVTGAR